MMEEFIHVLVALVIAAVDIAMIGIITIGSALTFWRVADRIIHRQALASKVRDIWLHFAACLLLALEFALAADLIETVLAPSWEEVRQLGAIAVIRIALGYFLGRDINEITEQEEEQEQAQEQIARAE